MPQELSYGSSILSSPNKNLRGLKALVPSNDASSAIPEEVINDDELAQRKAEEAGKILPLDLFSDRFFIFMFSIEEFFPFLFHSFFLFKLDI